ncbi:MAG TPA: protease pro-enzyme activation domain-containing protein [Bryobacteraceae bacterium]|nr:protease pro-enzyme activation domain-containing protein [Bryobacteraceae bacterium]
MSQRFGSKSLLVNSCALFLGFTGVVAAQSLEGAARTRALITQAIDPGRLYTLAGNTPSDANQQNDRGRVPDSFAMDHMMLQLRRSPEREQALQGFIDQQYDSKSPYFHKWLTAPDFGRMFGSAPADIEKITAWLRAGGFAVNTVYPSGMVIDFSGNAGQVLAAFHTEIHKLSVNGTEHYANISDPAIPEALAPAVTGIVSLHDFRPHSMLKARHQYTVSQFGLTYWLITPADLATIYNLQAAYSAGYTGQGQTIAVVEDSDLYDTNDWTQFRSALGLDTYTSGSLVTLQPAPPTGRTNCTDPGPGIVYGNDTEATADAEWASAAAPNAKIIVAACTDTTTFGGLIATQNLINGSSPPQIISMSYGNCEAGNGAAANATYNTAYQQAVAEGVSVFVSAGDQGAASCDAGSSAATHGVNVSAFASTPYNVAVGGTDFADTYLGTNDTYWSTTNTASFGSALSYIPEMPWNNSCGSSILADAWGYSKSYGAQGFCGSINAAQIGFESVVAASGGPSGCATGAPSVNLVVSGSCKGYPKPSWQTGVSGIPNDGVRGLPDVSLFAGNGIWGHYYVACFTDLSNGGADCNSTPENWVGLGGTSISAPVLAGIQALVNQKMGSKQGNPNPVYYKLAASSLASSVFHKVTMGDITVNCSGGIDCFGAEFVARGRAAFPTSFAGNGALSTSNSSFSAAYAAAGDWNFATGLGSVDAYALISNWTKGQ